MWSDLVAGATSCMEDVVTTPRINVFLPPGPPRGASAQAVRGVCRLRKPYPCSSDRRGRGTVARLSGRANPTDCASLGAVLVFTPGGPSRGWRRPRGCYSSKPHPLPTMPLPWPAQSGASAQALRGVCRLRKPYPCSSDRRRRGTVARLSGRANPTDCASLGAVLVFTPGGPSRGWRRPRGCYSSKPHPRPTMPLPWPAQSGASAQALRGVCRLQKPYPCSSDRRRRGIVARLSGRANPTDCASLGAVLVFTPGGPSRGWRRPRGCYSSKPHPLPTMPLPWPAQSGASAQALRGVCRLLPPSSDGRWSPCTLLHLSGSTFISDSSPRGPRP